MELMKGAVEVLVNQLECDVPDQALRIDFSRLPALPRFIIRNVRCA